MCAQLHQSVLSSENHIMVFGTRDLKYWVLGPSGIARPLCGTLWVGSAFKGRLGMLMAAVPRSCQRDAAALPGISWPSLRQLTKEVSPMKWPSSMTRLTSRTRTLHLAKSRRRRRCRFARLGAIGQMTPAFKEQTHQSRYLPATPHYPLRHPKYHLIETTRPLIEVHWGV